MTNTQQIGPLVLPGPPRHPGRPGGRPDPGSPRRPRGCCAAAAGASPLLAARRLADNPQAAFRSVTRARAGRLPRHRRWPACCRRSNATTATPAPTALSNVLLDGFTAAPVCGNNVNCTAAGGVPRPLVAGPGTAPAIPGHAAAASARAAERAAAAGRRPRLLMPGSGGPRRRRRAPATPEPRCGPAPAQGPAAGTAARIRTTASMSCARPAGAGGARPVRARPPAVVGPRPTTCSATTRRTARSRSRARPARPRPARRRRLCTCRPLLVKVNSSATLERVRTFLATHATAVRVGHRAADVRRGGPGPGWPSPTPCERLIYIAVALTLLVAGLQPRGVRRRQPGGAQAAVHAAAGDRHADADALPGRAAEAVLPLVAATVVAAGSPTASRADGRQDGAGRHARCRSQATPTT